MRLVSSLGVLALLGLSCAAREGRSTTPSGSTTRESRETRAAEDPVVRADAATDASGPTDASSPSSDAEARPTADATAPRAALDASRVAVAPPRPLEYTREITEADLVGRSLVELAILRNVIYARHGHRFYRPWLTQYFSSQPWYRPTRIVADSELTELERRNAATVGRFDGGLDRAALDRLVEALRRREREGELLDGDPQEAALLSRRLGTRITVAASPAGASRSAMQAFTDPNFGAGEEDPIQNVESLNSLLSRQMLSELSTRDLWILRNMVYAARGRAVRGTVLRRYFENANWYQPDPAYNDARLRRVDRQNLRLIQSVEAERGGPTNGRDEDEADQMMLEGA
jgi:hypothetical protein